MDGRLAETLSTGPDALAGLRRAWRAFQEEGRDGAGAIRPAILDSWRRSRELRVSPDLRAADVDRAGRFARGEPGPTARLFADCARSVAAELARDLAGSGSLVAVADGAGVILHRGGDGALLARTEPAHMVPGGLWDEECAGTNAVGLALALGGLAQVLAAEHFCEGWHDYGCTAAPVRHPVTGEVLGVLDVVTLAAHHAPTVAATARGAAREVEHRIERRLFARERELLARHLRRRTGAAAPVLTLDRSGRTLIQNAAAARSLSSEDVQVVLGFARRALHGGADVGTDVELSRGAARVEVELVRFEGELVGALAAARPTGPARPARPARRAPAEEWPGIAGRSPALRAVLRQADRAAARRLPAVIAGEAGTGKMALARALHERGPGGTLTVVHGGRPGWRAALDDAAAGGEGGTIVLRRLAGLDAAAQLELADAVEELGSAPPRAADPGAQAPWLLAIVGDGDPPLRLELLHRLGRVTLRVPPLREREGDVQLLVSDWCRRQAAEGRVAPAVDPAARDALAGRAWPGNVRELLNALESAHVRARGAAITAADLDPPTRPAPGTALRDVERDAIDRALVQAGGNVTAAARALGISRATLHRRLRSYRMLGDA